LYVSTLVQNTGLTPSDQERIGSELREAEQDVGALAKQTSRLLSDMTDTVSFVVGPDLQRTVIHHIDFLKLAPRKVLVVLAFKTGQVGNRVIETSEEYSADELQECARYLKAEFSNFTLLEAREALLLRMQEMRAIYNRLVANAFTLGKAAFADDLVPRDVYLEGTSRMLAKPEFKTNLERARQLLSLLEQKSQLLDILNAYLEGGGLQIVIGSEARVPGFEGISLITACYRFQGQELGALGIMGPTRMEYAKFIPVVDYMANSLSEAITPDS
jgi:heat-inducible transcriptional repressor